MTYLTNCVDSTAEAIGDMLDSSREITRRTFLKYVDRDNMRETELALGYVAHPSQGLTMAGDFHVCYHKGRYRGQRCIFFVWSAIEHIFTQH